MLLAPRIIVVDDDQTHLDGLVAGLHRYGTSCLPIHFTGDTTGLRKCPDLRLIFADLHLNEGGAGTDYERHFAVIGGLIEETFGPSGPYVLILWTRYAEQAEGLQKFLEARLQNVAKPLAVVPLDKKDHLDLTNGTVKDPLALAAAIGEIIKHQPQLAALLNWEERVLGAAADTASAILRITNAAADGAARSKDLARLLSRLAVEAVGEEHVDRDRFQAVNEALLPILADRIAFLSQRDMDADTWKDAFSAEDAGAALSTEEAAGLNRLLHVADGTGFHASDRGAVVILPSAFREDAFARIFGIDEKKAAEEQFACAGFDPRSDQYHWVLVQTQAACDYAQRQPGSVPFLLGLELPCASKAKSGKPPASMWSSPPFELREAPRFLHVNHRFQVTLSPEESAGLNASYRLRDQLLSNLVSMAHAYGARPGAITFHEKKAKPSSKTE